MAMAPGPLMVPITTAVLRRVGTRVRPVTLVAWGGAVFAAGMLWGVLMRTAHPAYFAVLFPQLVVGGIGVGLAMGNLLATGASMVPQAQVRCRDRRTEHGPPGRLEPRVAVLVTALATAGQSVRGYGLAWLVAAAAGLATTALAMWLRSRSRAVPAGL